MKDKLRTGLAEMSETICELKEDKESLKDQVKRLNLGLREVFAYLNEEIANATEIFFKSFVTQGITV